MKDRKIVLKKVKVHNLKDVDLSLNTNELIVFTGVSGSGKSSLAFDTIFVEGQRKYFESLAKGTKRLLKDLEKPEAEEISGLTPTIAVEQKTLNRSQRSTVGTITGIYDYLRVLFSRIGIFHCPETFEKVKPQSKEKIIKTIEKTYFEKKIIIFASFAENKKGSFERDFQSFLQKGFIRVKVDGKIKNISEMIALDPNKNHNIDIVIDRIKVTKENFSRVAEDITLALDICKNYIKIQNIETDEEKKFSEYAYSEKSKKSYGPLEPSHFSFNHPDGACKKCHGIGVFSDFDLNKIIDYEKSIAENCCSIASSYETIKYKNIFDNLARIYKFDISTPFKDLPRRAKNVFLNGSKQYLRMHFSHPRKKHLKWKENVKFIGVLGEAHKKFNQATSDHYKNKLKELMTIVTCPDCLGRRIKAYPAATTINDRHIYELTSMTCEEILIFFQNISLDSTDKLIAEDIIQEILKKLKFLTNVGLHYLTLDRRSPTLSGGEAQRVKLAALIGCGLIGTTYVLDEPSIGLHPSDHKKLIDTLLELRDKKNTIIVVEHDRDTIKAADTIVDIGPGAGKFGGEIIAQGNFQEIVNNKRSITGKYLSNELKIDFPKKYKKPKKFIKIIGASQNNLKNIDVKIPLNSLVCITGVSGSGKSSLISDILYPALSNLLNRSKLQEGNYKEILNAKENLEKVIFVDQSSIGKTPRSNPATYVKLLDDIRDLFSKLPESRMYGYKPGHFSFNVKEGSCPFCNGMGFIKIDMDFLEDQKVTCSECLGKRYDPEILRVKFKGKNIFDVLNLEVFDALELFSAFPKLKRKLQLLKDVGLEYIHLGQSANTLSGGEAQRIKLSKELSKPSNGKNLYILDEPTTGLHFEDICKLLKILRFLVDRGDSVIIIEHNMDFVKTADWIIDLGPGAGKDGGEIIGEGLFKSFIKEKTKTAKALKELISDEKVLLKDFKKEKIKKELSSNFIEIEKANEHNLKFVNLQIPLNQLTIFTGPSGSGKTSLAFDTIFQESQNRYIEALPQYIRQYFQHMKKPHVENIKNLSPCIAIEQKGHSKTPRSTVGTISEIYDYLRILYSTIGIAHCPDTKEVIKTISKEYVVNKLLEKYLDKKIIILSPFNNSKIVAFEEFLEKIRRQGFVRIRLNGKYFEVDEKIEFDNKQKNEIFIVIDRLIVKKSSETRLLEAIETAKKYSKSLVYVDVDQKDLFFNLDFAVESTGKSYPKITPSSFSFNSEKGMCLECQGLGKIISDIDLSEIFELSIFEIFDIFFKKEIIHSQELYLKYFKQFSIDTDTELEDLEEKDLHIFLNGSDKILKLDGINFQYRGLLTILKYVAKHAQHGLKWPLLMLSSKKNCPKCLGERLNPLALNVLVNKKSLPKICSLSVEKLYSFIKIIKVKKRFLLDILDQILKRLDFLKDIGLSYISLDRTSTTLSRGEMQRIYLSKQLGSSLQSCIYVIDEPTVGLHPENNHLLNKCLKKLKDFQNTLIVVEHDPLTIKEGDFIVDFGPKAGIHGGEIIAKGTLDQIKNSKNSLTGQYLSGRKKIPTPGKRRDFESFIEIEKATLHNLKNINIKIPLKTFCCISGMSGAGKSTLTKYILKNAIEKSLKSKTEIDEIDLSFAKVKNLKNIDKLIFLDQESFTFSHRADVSTYSDIAPLLRELYSSLPLSLTKGFKPRFFSYNHKRGMCKNCYGLGYKTIELQFLPPVKVTCDVCHGFRLTKQSLEVKFKDKNFGRLLSLSIEEAFNFFENFPKIIRKLNTLKNVGLGYLKLGQTMQSLSGGETQRLKLAKELSKRTTSNTIYILDEPTVGLHFEDVLKILEIFQKLVDQNNSLIIIEHNLDVLKNADYIIDLGLGGGENGGQIIAKGTPEEIIKSKNSYTAKYLREVL